MSRQRGSSGSRSGLIAPSSSAPTLASGADELGTANTVYIKAGKGGLRFVAPKTIVSGEEPRGPQHDQPETGRSAHLLAGPKGYVPENAKRAQALLHAEPHLQVDRQLARGQRRGTGDKNPAEAGLEGWDTMGTLTKKGDSWFTGQKPRASTRRPSAQRRARRSTSSAPSTPGCTARSKSSPRRPARPTAGHSTDSPRLGRRAFLGALGGGALATSLPLPLGLRPGALLRSSEPAPRPTGEPFRRPLPIPRVLSDAKLAIPIREADVQVLPGRPTRMWTYGGDFPGPTIRRPAGHRTEVTFRHELPRSAGELTVHLHGGHNRTQFDGQPGGLDRVPPALLLLPASPPACRRGNRATTS